MHRHWATVLDSWPKRMSTGPNTSDQKELMAGLGNQYYSILFVLINYVQSVESCLI